jgi:hypothetical protein
MIWVARTRTRSGVTLSEPIVTDELRGSWLRRQNSCPAFVNGTWRP